ncbi:MAG: AbrB/MazE/SpoVT family DNA-binding domain-containing protein [Candidatus Latescibacteria bacterium]|nr:AbrB/MazE/SpoVT family DNA-binding domain-containing protein [Candidatus Latescibacterota bacterium]
MLTTLTSKGQVTVPSTIRKQLKLQPGDQLDFVLRDDGHIEVVPVRGKLTALKGLVPKPERPVTLAEMDQAIVEGSRG